MAQVKKLGFGPIQHEQVVLGYFRQHGQIIRSSIVFAVPPERKHHEPNPTNAYTAPSVSISTARTGASAKANVLGMRAIGSSFADEPLSQHGFEWDWLVAPQCKESADQSNITVLRRVRSTAEKRAAEEVADRMPCADFEKFQPPV